MQLAAKTVLQNRYEIIRSIGEGGMGIVYEANDKRLGGSVALKQTKKSDPSLLKAFEREARILARMRHPALPRVSDHFTEKNGHFLVMDYIPSENLETLLQQQTHPFAVNQVLEWADQLLDALEYLHGQQPPVIHRDIKPANLKLLPSGQIILLDFGVSKGGNVYSTHQSSHNRSVSHFTPRYAPLEQIEGTGTNERSDIYSLGVTLHHLLTNTIPPDAVTRYNALQQNKRDPLPRTDQLNSEVQSSVAKVLQKAMEVESGLRWPSAKAMRQALRDATSGRKFSAATTKKPANRLPTPQNTTPRQKPNPVNVQTPSLPKKPLYQGPAPTFPPRSKIKKPDSSNLLAAFAIGWVLLLLLWVFLAVYSHDGVFIGYLIFQIVFSILFYVIYLLEEGKQVSCTFYFISNELLLLADGSKMVTFNINKNKEILIEINVGSIHANTSMALNTSCTTLAKSKYARVRLEIELWDVKSKTKQKTLEDSRLTRIMRFHPQEVILAGGTTSGSIKLWDTASSALLVILKRHSRAVTSLAFNKTGSILASTSDDKTIKLWNMKSYRMHANLEGHSKGVTSIAFSPDDAILASASNDKSIRLWEVASGTLLKIFGSHSKAVNKVMFSPDGMIIASASQDNTVKLWNVANGTLRTTLDHHVGKITSIDFTPDGQILASGSTNSVIKLWDVTTGMLLCNLKGHTKGVHKVAFSPDGQTLASSSYDGTVCLWDVVRE